MTLTSQNKKSLSNLQSQLSNILQLELFDDIGSQSICSTNGWINCLLSYDINPTDEDLKTLTNSVIEFENQFT